MWSIISAIFGNKTTLYKAVKLLGPTEFKMQIENKQVQLVDVRTAFEFRSGCINGAKNIDFFSGKFNVEFSKLDKEKPVYIYCRSGNRSRKAARKLTALGFGEVYDLEGGLLNYQ